VSRERALCVLASTLSAADFGHARCSVVDEKRGDVPGAERCERLS
jgi:hypothetical protein